MTLFQSTLPREERHCLIVKTSLYSYFNPRSHERSDLKRCKYMRYKIISIHAPTRGATVPASASHSSVVFQSTLPREERPGSFPAAVGLMLHFNPRSHERSDMRSSFPSSFISCISIHAPTRGATSSARIGCPRGVYISIHAPTRGATPIQIILFMSMIYFNPRSHERSDASVRQLP